jgi:hypothetical protein
VTGYPSDPSVAAPDFRIMPPLHGASRKQRLNIAFGFDHAIVGNSAILVDAVHLVSSHLPLSPRPEAENIRREIQALQLPLEKDVHGSVRAGDWEIGPTQPAL